MLKLNVAASHKWSVTRVLKTLIIKKLVVTLFLLVLKQSCKWWCLGFSWRMWLSPGVHQVSQPVEVPVVTSKFGDYSQISELPELADLVVRI